MAPTILELRENPVAFLLALVAMQPKCGEAISAQPPRQLQACMRKKAHTADCTTIGQISSHRWDGVPTTNWGG